MAPKCFGAQMMSQNAPNRVLRSGLRSVLQRSDGAPYQKRRLTTVEKCLVDHSCQFPDQNPKYAINFDTLPNLAGVPIKLTASPNQNIQNPNKPVITWPSSHCFTCQTQINAHTKKY